MNKLLPLALTALCAGCASVAPIKAPAPPVPAVVQTGTPVFVAPTLEQFKTRYIAVNELFNSKQSEAFNTFGVMLGLTWINTHKEEAMTKAAKHGRVQATPEEVWELPYANDWLGCIYYQFTNPNIFDQAGFESFAADQILVGWIEKNEARLNAAPATKYFVEQLKALPDWAAKCEAIVRDLDQPEGAINV